MITFCNFRGQTNVVENDQFSRGKDNFMGLKLYCWSKVHHALPRIGWKRKECECSTFGSSNYKQFFLLKGPMLEESCFLLRGKKANWQKNTHTKVKVIADSRSKIVWLHWWKNPLVSPNFRIDFLQVRRNLFWAAILIFKPLCDVRILIKWSKCHAKQMSNLEQVHNLPNQHDHLTTNTTSSTSTALFYYSLLLVCSRVSGGQNKFHQQFR